MDFVTHACVGALAGRALAPSKGERSAATACVRLGALTALLPDGDHVLELFSAEAYVLHHRGLTHSLLFAAVVTAAVAFLGSREGRGRRAVIAGAGLGSHLLLDLLTPFGTGVLWPSGLKLAFDGLQLVAPWVCALVVGACLAGWWAGRRGPGPGRKAALIGLAGLALFLAGEWGLARARAPAAESGAVVVSLPGWKRPWSTVSFVAEGGRLRHQVHPLTGEGRVVDPPARFAAEVDGPRLERARRAAAQHLSHFRLPVARRPWGGSHLAPVETEAEAEVVFEDAQFWAIDPSKPPLLIMVSAAGGVVVWEQLRPLQLFLWALATLGAFLLTRRGSAPALPGRDLAFPAESSEA